MERRLFNRSFLSLVAAGASWPIAGRAEPGGFPSLVSLVVPFAPGGGADQLAREFANAAQPLIPGTTFVIDNKPGANGAIANRHVARQKRNCLHSIRCVENCQRSQVCVVTHRALICALAFALAK